MSVTNYTIKRLISSAWIHPAIEPTPEQRHPPKDVWQGLRHWLDTIEVSNPSLARKLCQAIPAQCPFARTLKFRGRTLLAIPPLCKINPLYDELMALRFRAICYLADECGEDVSQYC
jgi:hypothetical protein